MSRWEKWQVMDYIVHHKDKCSECANLYRDAIDEKSSMTDKEWYKKATAHCKAVHDNY